jgi:hypothetical protein
MCDFDINSSGSDDQFNSRFRKFQDLVQFASPYIGFGEKSRSPKDASVKSTRVRNPPSTRIRTKITPLIKERQEEGPDSRSHPSRVSAELEGGLNERSRGKLNELVEGIVSYRPSLSADSLVGYVEKFIENYKVKIPKGKDRAALTLLYCIIMSSRLHNIYLDIHLLAINLDVPLKNIAAVINENAPPITTTDPLQRRLLDVIVNSSRDALAEEFSETMIRVVSGFPVEPRIDVSEGDVYKYKKNCQSLFSMLESDIGCDYDRQFCVTPDKVYIYAIFDVIREKVKTVTERVICDYLSSKFMIPRVTVEKMKRLIVKCRSHPA